MTRNWRAAVGLTATVILLGCAVVATAAWVSADRSPRGASARADGIHLAVGYLREPDGDWARGSTRTPLVAWLRNETGEDLVLRSVSSPLAARVEVNGGDLPVTIPSQGWVAFGGDGRGLQLRDLRRPLRSGDSAAVTFTFAGATLTARLPVVGADAASPSPATSTPAASGGKDASASSAPTKKSQPSPKASKKRKKATTTND